jgi:nicotinate-nucleotide adenylyltransferase
MKIGILGGTFDPVHLGHLLLAEMARETVGLQRVLFTPVADPPHKQGRGITPAAHRQAMVELALKSNARFELSSADLARPGPHYSIDTVRLIRRQLGVGPDDCYFIIGGDSLQDLPDWRQPAELIRLCRLAVAHRPGYQPDISGLVTKLPDLESRLVWVEMPEVGISASDIRARVEKERSIQYQVLEEVGQYIHTHQLYRSNRSSVARPKEQPI